MSPTIPLLLTAGLGLVALAASEPTDGPGEAPGVRGLPAKDAAPLLDDPEVVVLDIRTPPEVAQARLRDEQLHIDMHEPDFADQVGELDREARYVMYCRSGNRSGKARALFEQLGFQDVVDVSDGIIGWVDAGLPIQQG